jgi:excinuclease UvrABC nuclease subunit
MKKSRFKAPYNKEGKPAFSHAQLKTAKGVYLIKDKKGVLVYVGHSVKHLYKTMYRHFQEWNDNTQYRARYSKQGNTVRIVITTAQQAPRLEQALILKHRPRDNQQKLDLFLTPKIQQEVIEQYYESEFINPF